MLLLVTGACSDSGDSGDADGSPSNGSPGCGQAAPDAATDAVVVLEHAGLDREYVVHLPERYRPDEPAPLIFNLHGFGGDIASQDASTALPVEAGSRGYIVVTPQGAPLSVPDDAPQAAEAAQYEGFAFWNFFGSQGLDFGGTPPPGLEGVDPDDLGTDDVGFLDAVLDTMLAEHCVDPDRVFATGMSNGAGMSTTIGCELGDRIRAIGPVAGVNLSGACPGDAPVSVLAIHGDADSTAAYDGNLLLGFELGNPSVPERMAAWAAHDGCDAQPTLDDDTAGVVINRWSDCRDGTAVELWTLSGGGHTWPRGPGGDEPAPIDATDVVLDFFDEAAALT